MALGLSGKTALVTGGGSGIFLELTKKLLTGGCNVVVADLSLRPEAEDVVEKAKEVDTINTSSYKTFNINITDPIRATQLAIVYFLNQKLGHGVVIVSSIAAQSAFLPAPLYAASKHAMPGFTRSLTDLEPKLNIRVNAVAPGCVKTPLWTADKLTWVIEEIDTWVTAEKVAQTMVDLIIEKKNVGGAVLEVGVDLVCPVNRLNDRGPMGRGHSLEKLAAAITNMYGLIEENFGK